MINQAHTVTGTPLNYRVYTSCGPVTEEESSIERSSIKYMRPKHIDEQELLSDSPF